MTFCNRCELGMCTIFFREISNNKNNYQIKLHSTAKNMNDKLNILFYYNVINVSNV